MTDYARRHGLLRDARVREEIASLDAERDCQRIAHLLSAYEFTWDVQRSLEVALLHTYSSASVSRLLDRTGEFSRRGQKRYDDTQILINQFIESGWDGELGQRAIARINEIHGRYRIPNDDYLFVLWTFIAFPIAWCKDYAWRAFTPHEEHAWFTFWRGVGERMNIRDIPSTRDDFAAFVERYELAQLVPSEASRRVADATVAIMQAWLPAALKGVVQPAAAVLLSERARKAFGYDEPSEAMRMLVKTALRAHAAVNGNLPLTTYPGLLGSVPSRTYGGKVPDPEAMGP
jgi:hypothetical protein